MIAEVECKGNEGGDQTTGRGHYDGESITWFWAGNDAGEDAIVERNRLNDRCVLGRKGIASDASLKTL
jgi:hypothetical protein